jgi:hypothetical protein
MATENITQPIMQHLFVNADANIYAVLDAASIPNLLEQLYEQEPEYECLFIGELEPGMAEVAPYLVRLERNTEFTEWVIGKGWGEHWGVYVAAEADMKTMRLHLRSFLTVYDPDLKPLFFRYYDPRVLRVYLPTCNAKELETVFGPVEYYLLEDQDPNVALQFRNSNGQLIQGKVTLPKP